MKCLAIFLLATTKTIYNMEFYETKIKFEKVDESGVSKKVSESYLVDAMSFTEAESRIIDEMKPFISGEFEVSAVKKMKASEVMGEGDKVFMAKVLFITLDEKSGAEKKTASNMIVRANDFESAYNGLKDCMKGTMSDWEVGSLSETAIIDIYFKSDDNTTIDKA